jgi:hypothetical protein
MVLLKALVLEALLKSKRLKILMGMMRLVRHCAAKSTAASGGHLGATSASSSLAFVSARESSRS